MTNDDFRTAKREFESKDQPCVGFLVFKDWIEQQKKEAVETTNNSLSTDELTLCVAKQSIYYTLLEDYERYLEEKIQQTATEK